MPRFAGTPVDSNAPVPRFRGTPVKVDEPKTRGYGEELKRQAGLFGRDVIEGVYGLGGIVSDPLTQGYAALTGEPQPLASQSADYVATNLLGLPKPETRGERLASGVNQALVGTGGFIKAGKVLAGNAPGVVQRVGQALAERPGTQVGAAIGSEIAGDQAQEAGASIPLEFLARLGGAASGGGLVNVPQATANALRRFQVATPDQRAVEVLLREAGPMGLDGQPSRVPGVSRTLGEETLNPGIMALENTSRAGFRGQFDPQDTRNNAARVASLERIGGTQGQMEAAETARDEATKSLRDQAFAEGQANSAQAATSAREATEAAQREAVRARALGLPAPPPAASADSGKAGLRAKLSADAAAQGGRSAVQRALGAVVKDLDAADDSVEGLYRVRKSINDMIEGKAGTSRSFAKAATAELLDARALVDAEIAARAPTFGGYIEAYKVGSKPINRMQVGRELIESGSAAVRDESGIPRLTPGTFAKANDLDRIAQQATGFRKAKARDILTEQDISDIAAIQDDLQRQFARQKSATAGSQTFERGEIGGRIAQRGFRLLPFKLGDVMQFIDDRATDRVKERLAYLIANPAEARRIAAQLPPKDRAVLNKTLLTLTTRVAAQTQAQEGDR